jgi:hypothetical protein
MRPDESFDENSVKAKVTFAAAQLVYTLLFLLPTPLMYDSKTLCLGAVGVWALAVTYNGASYYLDVSATTNIRVAYRHVVTWNLLAPLCVSTRTVHAGAPSTSEVDIGQRLRHSFLLHRWR